MRYDLQPYSRMKNSGLKRMGKLRRVFQRPL